MGGGGDARKKTTLSNGVGAGPFSSAVDLKRAFVIGRAGGSFTSVAATDDEVSCIRERERRADELRVWRNGIYKGDILTRWDRRVGGGGRNR